ncbi:MAG TPA: GTPase Era [Terriglobales bacterium]|nr:GTPase Era [Terriglobales bacterium]
MRSGFVTIVGRPNAGKSTLLNALVGAKLAIVTHKPQTTRNRVQGILNVPAKKGRPATQVILIDTPGVHRAETRLNEKMMREVHEALEGSDLILMITDVSHKSDAGDQYVLDLVTRANTPIFLVLNKVDKIEKPKLLPEIERWSRLYNFKEVIPISALKKDGLDDLLRVIVNALPEGPEYFPKNQITDQPERFLASEIIREQVLISTAQEVPYASTVVIERWEDEPKLTRIAAAIYCEREGQKAILIGKQGMKLKEIGTAARLQIEKMLSKKVFLELFVKVQPEWRNSRRFVEEIDWRRQLENLVGPTE